MGQIFIQASNFGNLWQRGSFVYGLAIPSYPTPPSTSLMIDNERSGLVYVRTSDDSFNYFSNGTWHSISSGTGGGTVNSITAGTGLTGGTITTSGTIALATSGVTAGSYTSANITVDAFGRITTAANGSGGGGGVTSVGLTLPPTLFTITVSPITSSGSLTAVFVNPPAHSFFSGPTSGVSGQPTFRAIIASDLPSLSSTYVPFTGANQPIVLNDNSTINDVTNNTPSIASNGRVLIDENQFPVTSWSIGSISPDPTLLPLVSIGDIGNNGNSTMLTVNDTNQNIIMQSSAITATSLATGTVTQMVTCTSAGILGFQSIPGGGGSGTVTSVTSSDVTTATVATTTTTPVITIVSAPKLQTARTINGVSFDGSANITVTAAAGTLTGTTLNSTVVTSSLTSVGTVTSGTLSTGTVLGGVTVTLGSDATGDLYYRNSGGVLTRLPIGSSTNVLTVSGGLPSWAAPSSGGTVTSVATDATLTGGPITTTGTLGIATSAALPGSPTTTTQSTSDNSTKVATTAYVTTAVANAVAGINPAVAVQAATTANISGYTYNNGAAGVGATLTQNSAAVVIIDGYTLLLNDRVLFKDQSTAANNGVYVITTLGTGVIPAVFTRATDYNQPSDINNTGSIPVVNGTVNATTSWLLTSKVATVGTDSLTYTSFTINPSSIVTSVSGTTNRVTSTGGTTPVIDISASYVGQSSIITLGPVTTGTWKADKIDTTYLNTGITSLTATSSGIANVETAIITSPAIAANRLAVGTALRFILNGTCTSFGATSNTFILRLGTAGTISDAIVATATTGNSAGTGTNIGFRIIYEITVRIIGGAATAQAFMTILNTGSTGMLTVGANIILATMSSFDTTVANQKFTISYKSGAATLTATFYNATIEYVYN